MIDLSSIMGHRDVLFITLDTLRYDVAVQALAQGMTPLLAGLLPGGRWEKRHSPGSFTYAAHQAFFAGFLPTPARPGRHPRLFALEFPGSETIGSGTWVFNQPSIVAGFAALGYHTICIGGTGFFNTTTALGRVMPGYFAEHHWHPRLGVMDPHSTRHQVALAVERLQALPSERRAFLFINISALHRPNHGYLAGARQDTCETQMAALGYVDRELPPVIAALRARGGCLAILCSDHGTAYGDDGFNGHRLAHPAVWTVPYAEMVIAP